MKKLCLLLAACLMSLAAPQPGLAQQNKSGIERLYVLYCGDIALNDASSFTPGASGPGALSVTCYLVKHAQGWLLWDTGLPDAIVNMPDGQKSPAGVWTSRKTLASQRNVWETFFVACRQPRPVPAVHVAGAEGGVRVGAAGRRPAFQTGAAGDQGGR